MGVVELVGIAGALRCPIELQSTALMLMMARLPYRCDSGTLSLVNKQGNMYIDRHACEGIGVARVLVRWRLRWNLALRTVLGVGCG